MKNIIILFVVLLLTQPCISWSVQATTNCEPILKQLQEDLESQKALEASLVILMKNAGVPRLPFRGLFTTIPRTPKETQKLIDELSKTPISKNLLLIDGENKSACLE